MTNPNRDARSHGRLLRDALLTLMAVLLAFAAFDDITTDTATTFALEWSGPAACAAWLFVVSCRQVRSEHRWLGWMSFTALVIAVGAGSTIRPSAGPFRVE